jgi:hypothetical protein
VNRASWLVGLVSALLLGTATPARADLGNVTFEQFLTSSSLILVAHSVEAKLGATRSGRARLSVVRALRGRYAEPSITLEWSGEDDQPIPEVGRDYVLFLRKAGDRYVAAEFGMSYWLLTHTKDGRQVIEYAYPATEVKVPEKLISTVELWPAGRIERARPCMVEAILLERLIQLIGKPNGNTG